MANIRPKDTDTKASFASDDEVMLDSPAGLGTMVRDAFIAAVAAILKASPGTYGLATLDGAGKLTSSQDPSQPLSYKGTHNVSTNSPALADGSGVAGDTYQVNVAGSRDYGSGSLTLAVGDALVYNGSIWQQVSGVANILDGISTASAARTALEVNSKNEDAKANGTKLVGPALFFQVNDYIEFADSGKWSFVSATDDLPVTLEGFLSIDALPSVRYTIAAKYGAAATEYEYWLFIDSSGYVNFRISDTSGNYEQAQTTAPVPVGSRFHLSVTYGGSGPNSASAFTGAFSEMSIRFNGVLQTITDVSSGTYTGMSDTTEPFAIGRRNGADYLTGHISNLRVHNRELSASEITKYMNGEINFSDEYAGAEVYSGDSSAFTSTLGNWAEEGSTSITVAQSGGEMVITNTAASSGTRGANNTTDTLTEGKRYRLRFQSRASSGTGQSIAIRTFNSSPTSSVNVVSGSGSAGTVGTQNIYIFTPSASNETHIVEFIIAGEGTDSLLINLNNTGAGEVYNFDNITLSQIGVLADFRAEDFNESAGKLLDRSTNNFVGVNNGATLVGKRRHISAATINLTNLPTSSAGLSAGEVWSNSGVLTIV